MFTGESYRNLEAAVEIKPDVKGTRCEVLVRYQDLKDPIKVTGPQASGVLEYVLRRRVASTNDALDAIFQRVEEEKNVSGKHNGNGTSKPRRKRVLRDPEASRLRMKEAALRRWAKARENGQREALQGASTA